MVSKSKSIIPGGVTEYIAMCPKEVQGLLKKVRVAIQGVVPFAVETMSYFQIPGYSIGADHYYNGMFVWFSFKEPFIRLHVIPPVLKNHAKEIASYSSTQSVVSFPFDKPIPIGLIKKLTKASLKIMKGK